MEVDIYSAVDEGNFYLIRQYDEDLFQIEMKLKKKLDSGVTAEEFEPCMALLTAAESARRIVSLVQEGGN
ncbi:hypothetical protein [Succinimonas amylolytica]|uniref:hypothetical protein n=1 Tax=Succinimonas amylolytica TaxID=83769 RepID=UPI0023A893F5